MIRPKLFDLPVAALFAVTLAISPALTEGTSAQQIPVENRVLLRVNDRIVTQHTFERQVASAMAGLTQRDLPPDELARIRSELPKRVLRGLWDELLILSRADQLGLTVSDFEVDEAIEAQMEQFGMDSREELEAALAQSGMSMEDYRTNLRTGLLQRQVWSRELLPRVELEEDGLRRVYRENQEDYRLPETRDLQELVVLEGEAGSELDAIAAGVANAWSRGETPEEIREREGDVIRFIELGSVVRSELAPALGDVAFSLPEGQVSEPVVARGGLHIVKVVGIEPARRPAFEEVRNRVAEDERRRRLEEEREKYLGELEERAYYEANLPPELSGFQTSTGFNPGTGGLQSLSTSPLGVEITPEEERPETDPSGAAELD